VTSSISVALTTFNSARFIDEQLSSILAQSRRPDELVVADDGSSDDTLERIRRAVPADAGIALRILDGGGGLGVTRNFERAVVAASGDVVILCDHDDVWHPDRVSRAEHAFAADPSLLLVNSDARLVDADGEPLGYSLFASLGVGTEELDAVADGRAFEVYLRRNLVTGATTAFRRELLIDAAPFPVEWVHDEWLAMIAAATGRVATLPEELLEYRQHGANTIGVNRPTLGYRVRRMLAPRGDRYRELAARSQRLVERLEQLDVAPELVELARWKLEFERQRAAYPGRRLSRIGAIGRANRRGAYRELSSQGRLDILRDLMQPA
jgi:glycosyltransferase involved in cell wall biosynthesis